MLQWNENCNEASTAVKRVLLPVVELQQTQAFQLGWQRWFQEAPIQRGSVEVWAQVQQEYSAGGAVVLTDSHLIMTGSCLTEFHTALSEKPEGPGATANFGAVLTFAGPGSAAPSGAA